ncbi:amidohydrolase family protein [Chloroflexota bacterium]
MADAGVHLLGEIGMLGLTKPKDIKEMLGWARKYGMTVSAHFGGPTIVGSSSIPIDDMLEIQPDVVAHVNGGSTAPSLKDAERIVQESYFTLEVIHNGNAWMTYQVINMLKERGELNRAIIGADNPTGVAYLPVSTDVMIAEISSFNQIPAQDAIAMGTGNTADTFGLNTGKIEVGKEADILIIDRPLESVGDDALGAIEAGNTFGTAMIMVDGHIVALRGKDTTSTTKNVKIDGVEHNVETYEEWARGARHPGF